jgi:hypothetical protein
MGALKEHSTWESNRNKKTCLEERDCKLINVRKIKAINN